MPGLRQVFFILANVSRQRLPSSLRIPPLTLRLFTYCGISRSLPFVCNSVSGLSNTDNISSTSELQNIYWCQFASFSRPEFRLEYLCSTPIQSYQNSYAWTLFLQLIPIYQPILRKPMKTPGNYLIYSQEPIH